MVRLGAIGRAMAAVISLVLALPSVAAVESVRAAVSEHLAKELPATGNETNTCSDSSSSGGAGDGNGSIGLLTRSDFGT